MNKSVDYFNGTVDSLRGNLDKNTEWLENSTVANLVTLGLVVYAALFVGKIFPRGMNLFKHPLVKILSFLAVAYLARRNVALAFVATIAIVIIMMTNLKNTNEFLTHVPSRLNADDNMYEAMLGKCFCSCDGNKCVCRCAEGGEPENINIDDIIAEEEQVRIPIHQLVAPTHQDVAPSRQLDNLMIQVQVPEQIVSHLPQVVPQVKRVLPPRVSDVVDERDLIAQANASAMDKVKKQIIAHEMDKDKRRVVTTYTEGCDKSPYRRASTPFGQPNFLDEGLSYTTLDADYAPINFQ
jgi:hypothetical protein